MVVCIQRKHGVSGRSIWQYLTWCAEEGRGGVQEQEGCMSNCADNETQALRVAVEMESRWQI